MYGVHRIPVNMRTLTKSEAEERYHKGLPVFAMNNETGEIVQVNQYPWDKIDTSWHLNTITLLCDKNEPAWLHGIPEPKLTTGDKRSYIEQMKLYQALRNSDLGTDIKQSGTIHKLYEQVNAEKDWAIEIPYSHQGRSMDNIEAMEWLIEQYDLEEYIIDDSDTHITVSAPEDHRVLGIEVVGNGTEFEHLFSIVGYAKTPETLEKDIEILRKRQEETEKLIIQKYILREHRILFPEQDD